MLRRFLEDLVREVGLREAGRLIGRGREQVRKFVGGGIENPHQRTREKLGELFLDRHPELDGRRTEPAPAAEGVPERGAAERVARGTGPTPLKLILPRPLEKATAEIRALFALVRRQEGVPESAQAVEQWLLRQVKREYADEGAYARERQKKKK